MTLPTPIDWTPSGAVRILDQTLLPYTEGYRELDTVETLAEAIGTLRVRGAPLIGIAAAMGVAAVLARSGGGRGRQDALATVDGACAVLGATRPTAVNLRWALRRMLTVARGAEEATVAELREMLAAEAEAIAAEDVRTNRAIGRHGAALIRPGERILTHCNTGSLATVDYGTAFGIARAAHDDGKGIALIACETRPFLQGARLTVWEALRAGIPVTLITDNAAGALMARGLVDRVLVGADRIARNGDVANKIGTYTLAVLARAHELPFVVAAPLSTIDLEMPDGAAIPIEERPAGEVTHLGGVRVAPDGVRVVNPAFDVTPHHLVTAIVTEAGAAGPPYAETLPALFTAPVGG
jgi:methylthioribose-1-phosphate isomerase